MPEDVIPVLDGEVDEFWQNLKPQLISKPMYGGTPTFVSTATWKAAWDDEAIYVIIEIADDEWAPSWVTGANDWERGKHTVRQHLIKPKLLKEKSLYSYLVISIILSNLFESNRVGGFTEKGIITQWKLNKITKKEAIELSVHIVAKTGTYDVRFYVNANNKATAYVSGTGSRQLVFEGYLSPLEGSAAYEGETF